LVTLVGGLGLGFGFGFCAVPLPLFAGGVVLGSAVA
jgi:hypothetical protein